MTHETDPRETVPGEIDVAGRVESFARGSDLGEVARILAQRRDEIVGRWGEVTSRQAFHLGRRQRVVADHIPQLFDALVALLQRSAPRWTEHGPPLDDPAVLRAARDHARTRFEQGLQAADIVVEFRLLRQEIGRALRLHLASDVPTGDVIGASGRRPAVLIVASLRLPSVLLLRKRLLVRGAGLVTSSKESALRK